MIRREDTEQRDTAPVSAHTHAVSSPCRRVWPKQQREQELPPPNLVAWHSESSINIMQRPSICKSKIRV